MRSLRIVTALLMAGLMLAAALPSAGDLQMPDRKAHFAAFHSTPKIAAAATDVRVAIASDSDVIEEALLIPERVPRTSARVIATSLRI